MKLRRQWFRPGQRIKQIAGLAEHPFFARRGQTDGASTTGGAASAPVRRGWLNQIAENAGAIFSLAISTVLVVAIVATGYAFVKEWRRDGVVLRDFSAPRDVVDAGYTSDVIAQKIHDEILAIQHESDTSRSRRQVSAAAAIPDLKVAGTGMSVRSIVQYARAAFGAGEASVSGEMARDGAGLRMTMRYREGARVQLVEVRRSDGDVARLLKQVGIEFARVVDPYLVATYLYNREWPERRFPETRAAIDYVLSHPPQDDDAWALGLLGHVRYRERDTDGAVAAFRSALAREPGIISVRAGLIAVLQGEHRAGEIQAVLKGLAPPERMDSPDDLYAVADMMFSLRRWVDAVAYAKRLTAVAPQDFRGYLRQSAALYELHRRSAALAILEQGFAACPDEPPRYVIEFRAVLASGLGRTAEGLGILAGLPPLGSSENASFSDIPRSRVLLDAGRYEEALAAIDRAIAAGVGTPPSARTIRGDSLIGLGRNAEALVAMQDAVAKEPDFGPVLAGLGRAQLASGRPGDAAASFAAARKIDAHDPDVLRDWARALDAQGRKPEGEAMRREAKSVDLENAGPLPQPG